MTSGSGDHGERDASSGAGAPERVIAPVRRMFLDTQEYLDSRPSRAPAPEVLFGFRSKAGLSTEPRVVTAHVTESLGALYEAVIELAAADPTVDFDALLGARAVLDLTRGPRRRTVCGVVRRLERMESWGGSRRCRVVLVPALWALSQRTDQRIFQDKTAVEIVQAVIAAAGLPPSCVELQLTRTYPKREYCVQYRETDLDFVMRLLEDEGIASWFRHELDDEAWILSDSNTYALAPTINRRAVPYAPPQSGLAPVEVVQRFEYARELRSTGTMVRDFDFTQPFGELDATRAHPRADQGPRARYEYPGRFTHGGYEPNSHVYLTHDGSRRAALRHGEQTATEGHGVGTGNVTGFLPGRVFELVGHEHPELDGRYLITRLEHHAAAPEELLGDGDAKRASKGADRYRNTFECVRADVPWVPPRRTPRPEVLATQTATVVGPPGEEIYTDHYGRIKVQFHWDRLGRRDDASSCWIRVSQSWSGQGWGFVFLPRVGMEVVVAFLHGDPDQPLVTGCVYNGAHGTPEPLPATKTRSAIRTNSTPGGSGYNELAFEDRAGDEQVFVRAQRNYDEVVGLDRSTTVARNRTHAVSGDETLSVTGNDRADVGRDRERRVGGAQRTEIALRRSTSVGGDDELRVLGQSRTQVERAAVVEVRGDSTLLVGSEDKPSTREEYVFGTANIAAKEAFTLRSETSIVLQCGDSRVEILPDKIVLRSPAVEFRAEDSLVLKTKDGPTVTLGEDVEMLSKKLRVFTEGASLELDKEAKVKGAKIKLGYDSSKPERTSDEKDPETKQFKCRLTDYHFDPLANRTYHLTVEGLRFEGTTDGDGNIAAEIPKSARQASVRVWLDEYPKGRQQLYTFRLEDEMPPASDVAGAKLRLKNLGYYQGEIDGEETSDFRSALAGFQQDHRDSDGLEPNGELDGKTVSALEKVHGH